MNEEELQPQEAETPEEKEEFNNGSNWEAEAKKYKAMADRRKKEIEKIKNSSTDNPIKDKSDKSEKKAEISIIDMTQHFATGGTKTELRRIEKIMKNGKSFSEAKSSKDFKSWKRYNDQYNKDMEKDVNSQIDPSNGGSPAKDRKSLNKDEKDFLDAMGVKDKK